MNKFLFIPYQLLGLPDFKAVTEGFILYKILRLPEKQDVSVRCLSQMGVQEKERYNSIFT